MTTTADARPFFLRAEALRGVCAAVVAGYHMAGFDTPDGQLLPLQPWPDAGVAQNAIGWVELHLFPGHAALMTFFAISGFVLRLSLQYGPQHFGAAALRFHVARIFRIYPIVIVGMVFAAAMHGWRDPATGAPVTPSLLAANALLRDASLNPTLWAVQLEVVIAPVIVLLYFLERWRGPWALLAVALVATPLAFAKWTWWAPLSEYVFAFALGMLIPTLGRARLTRLSRRSADRWLAGAVLAMFLAWPVFGFFTRFAAITEGYAASLLVCVVAYRPSFPGAGFLDWRATRLLGRVSGSFYVLHAPFLSTVAPLIIGALPAALFIRAPALAGPLTIIVGLTLFAPLAVLGYYLVESPGIAVGRWLTRSAARALRPAMPAAASPSPPPRAL